MSWIVLAFGAALSWGMYGASLHRGQLALGNPMRALLCVGVAYFLIGVLVPAGCSTNACGLNHCSGLPLTAFDASKPGA